MDLISSQLKERNEYEPISLISGGKDSSVIMHLVRKILPNSKSIFNNTTLDCSDTYKYIKTIPNVETITPKEGFYQWRKRIQFIPTRFQRACCGIFKEGAMIDYLDKSNKYLFFLGMRNEESSKRSNYQDLWNNEKWCDNWKGVLPVRKWSELDIWLYIILENIPINTKYKKGYSRVGCAIACPYATKSTWVLDKYFYPTMRDRWERILKEDFINNGKWSALNCTLKEYIDIAWNGGKIRDEPTQEILKEFMDYKNIKDINIAKKYFNNNCSCGKRVNKDECGLSMKYFGRNNNEMFCFKCLSKELGRTKAELKEDIKRFKQQGCDLF